MSRVLVLGANGLLGTTLVKFLRAREHDVLIHARQGKADVVGDLRDAESVRLALDQTAPDVVINLAALTNVDECERSPMDAYLTNVRVVECIVNVLEVNGMSSHLIQISTDQVYDGDGPHEEKNVVLSNYYAFSKYAAELVAARVASTVLRTNFFGFSERPGRASLSDWIVTSLRERKSITVFEDIHFTPLSMSRVVKMIDLVITRRPRGVFNLGSRAGMSKADFAFALAGVVGLPTASMIRGTSDHLNLLAYRPKDMRMDSSSLELALGVTLPTLQEEIETMKSAYAN